MRFYPYKNVCERRILFTPQYFDADELKILTDRIRDGLHLHRCGLECGLVRALSGAGGRDRRRDPDPGGGAAARDLRPPDLQHPPESLRARSRRSTAPWPTRPGELTLFLDPRNRGEASLKIVNSSQTDAIRVPAVTLLELLNREGLAHVDAIKLDVEGAEDLVLDPFFRDAPAALYPVALHRRQRARALADRCRSACSTSKGYRQILETKMNLVFERP